MNTVIAVVEIAAVVAFSTLVVVPVALAASTSRPTRAGLAQLGRRAFAFEPWTHDVSLAVARR